MGMSEINSKQTLGIVSSEEDSKILKRLLDASRAVANKNNIDQIEEISVPGILELVMGAKLLAESGNVDCIVCIGSIKSAPVNYPDLVSSSAINSLMAVQLKTDVPISWGIVNYNYDEQAYLQSVSFATDPDYFNLAESATQSAINMAKTKSNFYRNKKDTNYPT